MAQVEIMLNTNQVASILQVKPQTLYIWRAQRKGPSYAKIGRKVLYPIHAINEFIEKKMKKEVEA